VGDGSWVHDDCLKHMKYVDSVCFRSTRSVGEQIDCDRTIDR
jgi:hypothetical protein